MKMRKILASVVAAAVATSAMAISAFAAVVKDINNDATVYNATVTANVNGALDTAGTALGFKVNTLAGDTVNKVTVELKIITDGDKVTTITKSADGDTVAFSTNTGAGFDDITKVANNAAYQATVTALVSNTTAAYAAADADTNYTVAVTNGTGAAANGKVVVNDNTSEAGAVTGYTFDVSKFTVAERAEIKAAEKVTLTVNFNKASTTDNGLVTLKKGGDNYAVKVVAKGATSATFDLAIADFYNADYDAFEAPAFTFTIASAGDATGFTSAKLVFGEVEDDIEEPGEDDEEEGEEEGEEEDEEGENPKTGVALAVLPAVIGGAATLIARKRK